jgi:hypothetical protein
MMDRRRFFGSAAGVFRPVPRLRAGTACSVRTRSDEGLWGRWFSVLEDSKGQDRDGIEKVLFF